MQNDSGLAQGPDSPFRARLRVRETHRTGWERPMSGIKRRKFIVLLGGAATWPLAARAAEPHPRIAVLSINSEQDESKNIAAFVDGLRALGYVSQNVDIDYRYAAGDTTRLKR